MYLCIPFSLTEINLLLHPKTDAMKKEF